MYVISLRKVFICKFFSYLQIGFILINKSTGCINFTQSTKQQTEKKGTNHFNLRKITVKRIFDFDGGAI